MPTNEPLPGYLKHATRTDDERWDHMQWRFRDLCDLIEHHLVETREEAIGKKTDQGWRRTHKADRAWLMIPRVKAVNDSWVNEQLEFARSQVEWLEVAFRRREQSIEFLEKWGSFCCACGAIELLYQSESDDWTQERAGRAGKDATSTEKQKRWASHYLVREFDRLKSRPRADDALQRLIKSIICGGTPIPELFDRDWFRRMLNAEGTLREAYQQKRLSITQARVRTH